MFTQFEIMLTSLCLALSAILTGWTVLRIVQWTARKKTRTSVFDSSVPVHLKISKMLKAFALLLLFPNVVYFIFAVFIAASVIRDAAKVLFLIAFLAWTILEVRQCFLVPNPKSKKTAIKTALFHGFTLIILAIDIVLLPKTIASHPFPPESESVILDLPVRGTWLAGQAGASLITNNHSKNRYAIDFVRLGSDNRFYTKGKEEKVTDFHSYGESLFSPAGGLVTEVVDHLESDSLAQPDRVNSGGNFIIIDIGDGKYAYFGHLKKNSIAVKPGDRVESGDFLGLVGNSGNTMMPHLHMHVQDQPLSGNPDRKTFPFRFRKMERMRILFWFDVENGTLLRNDRIRSMEPISG